MTDTSKEEIEKLAKRLRLSATGISIHEDFYRADCRDAYHALLALLREQDAAHAYVISRDDDLMNLGHLVYDENGSEWKSRALASEAHVERLKTALEPFAQAFNEAEAGYYWSDEESFPRTRLTYGDFRRLRDAYVALAAALAIEAAAQDYAT